MRSDGRPNISSFGRKATIREFYSKCYFQMPMQFTWDLNAINVVLLATTAVILPYLQRLYSDSSDMDNGTVMSDPLSRKRLDDKRKVSVSDMDADREDECGICLELGPKVVLPSCCHTMCIKCYRDWYSRP